jgi:transcriptional regulator of acetoin/glycerol metabolism
MPRCPFCGYSWPETADIEVPTTSRDPRTLADSVDSPAPQSSLFGHALVGTTLRGLETLLITATLQHTSGNVKAAAAILGIDRSTMYDKIKRYQIARP